MGLDRRGGSRGAAWRARRPFRSPLVNLALSRRRAVRDGPRWLALRIERVGQRDGVEVGAVGVLRQRGIDVEDHRHVAGLARLQALLGEAEAVDLLEEGSGTERRDIISRRRSDRTRRLVDDTIVDRDNLAEPYLNRVLLGLEAPRQARTDIGVEPHDDRTAKRAGWRGGRDLRGAIETGGAAEPVV